jgi:hypothetical protein
MSSLKTVIFFIGCLLGVTALRAQAVPVSLVGTWELNLTKSDFGSLQKPIFSITRTISQPGSAEIDVADQINHPAVIESVTALGATVPPAPVVKPGRTEQENAQLFTDGRHFTLTTHRASFSTEAQWNGSRLVVVVHGTRTNESDNGTKSESPFDQQQVWTLSSNGKSLQIKQTTTFGQSSNTVVYFFDRK